MDQLWFNDCPNDDVEHAVFEKVMNAVHSVGENDEKIGFKRDQPAVSLLFRRMERRR